MTETDGPKPEPVPKPKFWTTPRIFAIVASIFLSFGAYLYLRHAAPSLSGVIIVIGIIIAIVLLVRTTNR